MGVGLYWVWVCIAQTRVCINDGLAIGWGLGLVRMKIKFGLDLGSKIWI